MCAVECPDRNVCPLMPAALHTCRAMRAASRLTCALRGLLHRAAASPWQCRCNRTELKRTCFPLRCMKNPAKKGGSVSKFWLYRPVLWLSRCGYKETQTCVCHDIAARSCCCWSTPSCLLSDELAG